MKEQQDNDNKMTNNNNSRRRRRRANVKSNVRQSAGEEDAKLSNAQTAETQAAFKPTSAARRPDRHPIQVQPPRPDKRKTKEGIEPEEKQQAEKKKKKKKMATDRWASEYYTRSAGGETAVAHFLFFLYIPICSILDKEERLARGKALRLHLSNPTWHFLAFHYSFQSIGLELSAAPVTLREKEAKEKEKEEYQIYSKKSSKKGGNKQVGEKAYRTSGRRKGAENEVQKGKLPPVPTLPKVF
ncbi:hypothetical protein TRV_00044 [Trichophyton verrucosum HKI 0517]|uniref:Uncharacterized protein n=1 Tax=Trichophyton verrucosum (strain HKI 0517) TaxID=663202 RepID=D4CZ07_TRIVH|nr:uncharacterized protein TRV_00044 [Trichophyton verrucosum HKI 0517]EFE45171.1 hypothetical protein TRV_00044 [Trichophyton verrucosum HKI 0517]